MQLIAFLNDQKKKNLEKGDEVLQEEIDDNIVSKNN
jgi:hypothetical protein